MGYRILTLRDDFDGEDLPSGACFADTVTDWVFGPIFDDVLSAEMFTSWLAEVKGVEDPRRLTDGEMEDLYSEWSVPPH